MQENLWRATIHTLPLGQQYFFDQVGSTNDVARELLDEGAPDLSLVVADEQTAGRGRNNRTWITTQGAALAFSVILRPESGNLAGENLGRVSGLGGVAVAKALQKNYALRAELKWPNDVLVNGKKVAGVLAEAHWIGHKLRGVILGIGINVLPQSVPVSEALNFPATSVVDEYGEEVARPILLAQILGELLDWYPILKSGDLLQAWEENLAFKGMSVRLDGGDSPHVEGQVLGLNPDGSLRLGVGREVKSFQVGEIQIRAVDISPK